MKKILSLLLLVSIIGVSGCSYNEKGTYKFDSVVVENKKGEKITYTCSQEELSQLKSIDKATVTAACTVVENISYELKKDDILIKKIKDEVTDEVFYKIEDGKLYTKMSEGAQYAEIGTYEKGTITTTFSKYSVILKKVN